LFNVTSRTSSLPHLQGIRQLRTFKAPLSIGADINQWWITHVKESSLNTSGAPGIVNVEIHTAPKKNDLIPHYQTLPNKCRFIEIF
jgi:hypothetical protein